MTDTEGPRAFSYASNPIEIGYVGAVLFGRPLADDSFWGRLLRLVPSADPESRRRLRAGFPELVGAYEAWVASPDGTGWEADWAGDMIGPADHPSDPQSVAGLAGMATIYASVARMLAARWERKAAELGHSEDDVDAGMALALQFCARELIGLADTSVETP